MSQRLLRHPSDLTDAARRTLAELGEILRSARQARGEDLYDVAHRLRIKPSYLYAIEQGDLALTPGRPYALGFLRTYADHLGFDGNEVVEHVKDALDTTAPPPELHYRTPIAERGRPGGIVLGLSILLVAGVYGAWHVHFRDNPVLERVSAVPGELGRIASGILELDGAAPAGPGPLAEAPRRDQVPPTGAASIPRQPGPAEVAPPVVVASRSLPAETTPPPLVAQDIPAGGTDPAPARPAFVSPAASPISPTQASAAAPPPTDQADPAVAQGATAAAPPVTARELLAGLAVEPSQGSAAVPGQAAGESDGSRVVLVAIEASWIQVRSGDREFVRTKTMEPGERMALPDRQDLALWTGNAGGLEILVDGRSTGPLGQRGRVLRDVPLEPEALRTRFASGR